MQHTAADIIDILLTIQDSFLKTRLSKRYFYRSDDARREVGLEFLGQESLAHVCFSSTLTKVNNSAGFLWALMGPGCYHSTVKASY